MRANAAEWMPDQPPFEAPGAAEIKNVYPVARGYKPIGAIVANSSNAMASAATGYFAGYGPDGSTAVFTADALHLYSYSNQTFADVSRSAPYAAQAQGAFWEFVQFGNRIIATTVENAMQYFDLGTSTLFADLPGSPPKAKHIAVVRDFIVAGNTDASPFEVRWCGNQDSETWAAEVKESSSQILRDGGAVQAIIGGEVGYIIQERQLTRMTFVGPPLHFQFDVIQQGYGCFCPYSVTRVGRRAYYVGTDGFQAFDLDAGALSPIGSERVDRWFSDNVSSVYLAGVKGASDTARKIIWWSFADGTSETGAFNHVIGYQWQVNRWFHAIFDHDMLSTTFTAGLSLDSLLSPDIDTLTTPLDAASWLGGGLAQLGAFDTSHRLGALSGDNLEATIETSEIEPVESRRCVVTNARPLTDAIDATITVSGRERLADSAVTTASATLESNGNAAILASGRYFKITTVIPEGADWTFWSGCDLDAVDDGLQ